MSLGAAVECGFNDRSENGAPQSPFNQLGEKTFDGIEPGAGHRGEAKHETLVPVEPFAFGEMLVGGVVIQGFPDPNLRPDSVQEANELLMAMALHCAANHFAVESVQRPKQRSCSKPLESCVIALTSPFFSGRPGWVRPSAWIWLFSSAERTIARSRGLT
jgi:hypothetical protein